MSAAGHIGRVGGLAVALGIGTAVLTGHGVACAAPDSGAGSATSHDEGAASPAKASPLAKHGVERAIAKLPSALRQVATDIGDATRGLDAKAKPARPRTTVGSRRNDDSTPTANRPKVAAKADSTSSSDSPADSTRSTLPRLGRPTLDEVEGALAKAFAPPAKAVRTPATTTAPSPALSTAAVTAPASLAATAVPKVIATAVQDVLDPGAGTDPVTPAANPVSWVLAAASRRELAGNSVDYDPKIAVVDGVITAQQSTVPPNMIYTVVGQPSGGGKATIVDKATGEVSYLPYATGTNADGTPQFADSEQFEVMAAENTAFDRALEGLPVVGGLVAPVLVELHQVPVLGVVLSPLIGRATVSTVTVDDAQLAAGYTIGGVKAPIAFTTTVVSFDGTPISVNWFPAKGLTDGVVAPTILNGPSLATAGYTNPNQETTVFGLVPGLDQLRDGYNVVTWDPRGEYASGGVLQLDSPDYEAKDVSAIITWVAGQPNTKFDPNTPVDPSKASTPDGTVNNPLIGMVGGSYGGGIQLTSAGIDERIDAIAPGIAWNNLNTTLYPNHAFKTAFASLLLLSLVASDSRINPNIYIGIATGALLGVLLPAQRDFLEQSSPSNVVDDIDIPTLFLQGTVDVLFPLQQSVDNLTEIQAADPTDPVKMIWYCGGHGQCLDPVDANAQTAFLAKETMAWMDTYVMYKGQTPPAADTIPNFQWVDQNGTLYSSQYLPIEGSQLYAGSAPITVTSGGGVLPIAPLLGGSGPSLQAGFPVDLATASKAIVAVDVPVPNPASPDQQAATYVVGQPTVTLHYSGLGTTRTVYAQLVDKNTGRVVGNILTPIPVTLDGQSREVTVPMEDVAYTMDTDDPLELQIVGTATPYENLTSYGVINISQVDLTLPTANPNAVTYEDSFHTDQPPAPSGSLLGI